MINVTYYMKKIRLSDEENGLYDLLSKQGFNFTHLARKVDRTTSGLIKMLRGQTTRYDENVLEGLSKETGLLYNRDENGLFFYDPDDEGRMVADLDRQLQELIRLWEDLTPAQKAKYLAIIKLLD